MIVLGKTEVCTRQRAVVSTRYTYCQPQGSAVHAVTTITGQSASKRKPQRGPHQADGPTGPGDEVGHFDTMTRRDLR